jgi:hypothetical protein
MRITSTFTAREGKAYLSPTVETLAISIERGFEASLPGISTEEGDDWVEY